MKRNKRELWFGVYGREYGIDEPAFFSDANLPCAEFLRDSYPTIKEELAPLMKEENEDLQPYFSSELQYPPKNWKTIGFYFWGKKNRTNAKRFPKLFDVLSKIPGLVTASLNMLEPHSRILAHFGETNGTYRVHLGMQIPASLPVCGFTVKGESRSWKDGELLIFLDANVHEAHNDSNNRRYILLLDIVRPEFEEQKKRICIQALSILSLYYVMAHIPGLPIRKLQENAANIPDVLTDIFLIPFKVVWHVLWKAQCWGLNQR